jgi:Bromodomain
MCTLAVVEKLPVSFEIYRSTINEINMSAPTAGAGSSGTISASQPSPQGQNALTASQQEALKRVTKIIDAFVLRNDCAPFLEPVDWRGLELYDYPTIIKKPMDLGTIKRKLERNQYKSAAYCVADIRRVWNNCMTYNTVGSDFYILAKNCSKRFEDRYRRIRNECT